MSDPNIAQEDRGPGPWVDDTGIVEVKADQEIAVVDGHALAVPEQKAIEVAFTPAQKEMIKAINPDANPAELQVFMYQAARTGLDPIAKQIYLIKRKGKMSIQTGIDGFRLVGHRTGMIAGVDDAVFEDGPDGLPVKATVTIWRIAADGQRYPYTATARWSEYAPDMSLPESFMWKKMPHSQLGKCAEALAWRKVCPAELSGVYTDDEMAQADFRTIGQGKPENLTEYRCPHCGSAVIDNREAPLTARGTRPPAWKCSNRSCGGGAVKKDRNGNPTDEHWEWGTYDTGYFEPGGDGGDYGGIQEAIVVTTAEPANPDPEAIARAWDGPPEDAWRELMLALNTAPSSDMTLIQLEGATTTLCLLMEKVGLWPAGSMTALLQKWAGVTAWRQLDKKADKLKFAVGVFEAVKKKVEEQS